MPSTFPEAFGMVAAEAAACGVLPLSAGHSGHGRGDRHARARAARGAAAAAAPSRWARGRWRRSPRSWWRGSRWTPPSGSAPGARWRPRRPRRYSWESVAEGVIAAPGGSRPSPQRIVFPPREPRPEHGKRASRGAAVVAAAALSLAACGRDEADLSNGKALFVQKCGSCHVARPRGHAGPDRARPRRRLPRRARGRHGPRDRRGRSSTSRSCNPRKNSVMPPELVTGRRRARRGRLRRLRRRPRRARTRARWRRRASPAPRAASRSSPPPAAPAATRSPRRTPPGTSDRAWTSWPRRPASRSGTPEDYVRESVLDPDAVRRRAASSRA